MFDNFSLLNFLINLDWENTFFLFCSIPEVVEYFQPTVHESQEHIDGTDQAHHKTR